MTGVFPRLIAAGDELEQYSTHAPPLSKNFYKIFLYFIFKICLIYVKISVIILNICVISNMKHSIDYYGVPHIRFITYIRKTTKKKQYEYRIRNNR